MIEVRSYLTHLSHLNSEELDDLKILSDYLIKIGATISSYPHETVDESLNLNHLHLSFRFFHDGSACKDEIKFLITCNGQVVSECLTSLLDEIDCLIIEHKKKGIGPGRHVQKYAA